MAQNIYDDPQFYAAYGQLRRSVEGLDGAPEWPSLRALLPDLARVAEAFAEAASGTLPIHCHAGAITLLDTRQGQRWQIRTSFPLGE